MSWGGGGEGINRRGREQREWWVSEKVRRPRGTREGDGWDGGWGSRVRVRVRGGDSSGGFVIPFVGGGRGWETGWLGVG